MLTWKGRVWRGSRREPRVRASWLGAPLFLMLNCVSVLAQSTSVAGVSITVADLERSKAFYTQILDCRVVQEGEESGDALERRTGVFASRVRTARLRLGDESIELVEFVTGSGRPVPADSRSNDRWFQHIAIAVSDMDAAYARLRERRVRQVSPEPQTLPAWNEAAAGIRAFYFKDPDGHVLELIQFPTGKGDPRWHAAPPGGPLFQGIDHTAIVVQDTERALAFYRDGLGLRVAGVSENYGPEQERLNGVFGARLRITTLRAQDGPGVELLEYVTPSNGRDYPHDSQASDLWHWHTAFSVSTPDATAAGLGARRISVRSGGDRAATEPVLLRDPDGHAVLLSRGAPPAAIAPADAASKEHDDHARNPAHSGRPGSTGHTRPRRRVRGHRLAQGVVDRRARACTGAGDVRRGVRAVGRVRGPGARRRAARLRGQRPRS